MRVFLHTGFPAEDQEPKGKQDDATGCRFSLPGDL